MKKEIFKNVVWLFGYIVCFIILYCFFDNYREDIQNNIFLMINMIQYVSLILIILITVFIVISSFIWFEIKAFKKEKTVEFEEKINEWLKKEMVCIPVLGCCYCLFHSKIISYFGNECLYAITIVLSLIVITGYKIFLLNTYYLITETPIYKKYVKIDHEE